MKQDIIKRVIAEAKYMIKTGTTIREIASVFAVSKSTVHKDLSKRLFKIDRNLYLRTHKIIDQHLKIRHIKGGQSTKNKFSKKKQEYLDKLTIYGKINLKDGERMFNKDIGIDLGTANVLIYIKGQGIVLNEPSVVAIDSETKKPLAVGNAAHDMLGRTPGKVKAIKPMKDGVIADFETTEVMLNHFIKKVNGKNFFSRPRILICCPSNITQVEKNAIKEAAERTGAKKVFLEEEPKVAAIGAGMDISKPSGNMVIDIGGGTTDIAILSLGGIVNSASIRIAGNAFDNDIVKYIKDKYKLLVGERTAEDIKKSIGTVFPKSKNEKMEVRGRDLVTGLPHTITLSSDEVEEALRESVFTLVHAAKGILEQTPPELSADIIDKGIVLTGGGSLVDGFSQLLSQELKVPVFIAESPLTCVAEGTGILLDNLHLVDR